jgi:hypothetical protein
MSALARSHILRPVFQGTAGFVVSVKSYLDAVFWASGIPISGVYHAMFFTPDLYRQLLNPNTWLDGFCSFAPVGFGGDQRARGSFHVYDLFQGLGDQATIMSAHLPTRRLLR